MTTLGQDYLGERGVKAVSCSLEDQMPNKHRDHVPRCPQGTRKEPAPGLSKGWVRHVKGQAASENSKASTNQDKARLATVVHQDEK